MRFETRFANGYWRSFDTQRYTTVRLHYLLSEAVSDVAWMNSRESS
jgi:hypothetical protein